MLKLGNLRLGVATASAQIEGGEVGSNWNAYSDAGKIYDGSNVKRAADHWNRYVEDIELLDQLRIRDYRMSVEWARLEPQPGVFDEQAFAHYRDEIQCMQAKGIRVLLTLYHFSHPQWFEEMGSFEKLENIPIFLRFVDQVVLRLGDLVEDYCTLNEPNVYAVNGYFFGEWLQEEKSLSKTLKVMNIFIACHHKAYQLIKTIHKAQGYGNPNITLAMHMRIFDPLTKTHLDRLGAKLLDRLFQTNFFKAVALGEFIYPFQNLLNSPKSLYIDLIGLNYYSRGLVHHFQDTVKRDAIKNDLGWEIYPEGLVRAAQQLYDIIPLPIRVTENGTCDNHDAYRSRYIYDHLMSMMASDLPFTHYYHWCFTDNFEWKEGEVARFGLVQTDYETQKRTIKSSGHFYAEMIAAQGVTPEMYKRYVADQTYHHGQVNVLRGMLPEEVLRNKR